MPIYRYTAIATPGVGAAPAGDVDRAPAARVTKGTLAADSDQHLRAALRGMGLQPLSIRPLKHGPAPRPRRSRAGTVTHGEDAQPSDSGALDGEPAPGHPLDDAGATRPHPHPRTRPRTDPRGRFAFAASLASIARRRRSAALVEFYEGLATLLASGAPLASSLDLLGPRPDARTSGGIRTGLFGQMRAALTARGPERRMETVCLALAERVRGGASLADALAEHPGWFGRIDTALVASCERSGHAERALTDLADLHARGEDLRGRLAGALAYPALLLIFGLGVVVFLTTTTLPQLAGVLEDGGAQLPPATAILLAFGGLLTEHWPLTVVLLIALGAGIGYFMKSDSFARVRLRVPLLGRASLRGQTSAAALLLSRLLDAGVPLSESVELVAPGVPNSALRDELLALRDALVSGGSLSARASSGGLIEPVFCRVLEVAEESGEMASALRTIGLRQRESAKRLIDRLAATLEPVVILALACGIGFVVYASIAPMLRVAQTL